MYVKHNHLKLIPVIIYVKASVRILNTSKEEKDEAVWNCNKNNA
uniref:Uncharacterized protein n=1 Tax=Arundo donax TaxID=35708 RepID=A0A0A8Y0M2_ARUDO